MRWDALMEILDGLDIFPKENVGEKNEDSYRKSTYTHGTKNDDESHTKDAENPLKFSDLQEGFSTMDAEATRPTTKEFELFTARLLPIFHKFNNKHISACYQPSVIFSLLSDPTRDAWEKLEILNISLEKMIYDTQLEVLYDIDIQDRRISHCTSVECSEFRRDTDKEEKATRKCIKFMTKYQKDLPEHISVLALLYNRYGKMFRDNSRCETLYQRAEASEDTEAFSQKLFLMQINMISLLTRRTTFLHVHLILTSSLMPINLLLLKRIP